MWGPCGEPCRTPAGLGLPQLVPQDSLPSARPTGRSLEDQECCLSSSPRQASAWSCRGLQTVRWGVSGVPTIPSDQARCWATL